LIVDVRDDVEHLNQALFQLINAAQNTPGITINSAELLANGLIWLVPTGLLVGWFRGSLLLRQLLVTAIVSGLAGLLINQLIGLAWYHPRPIEAGVGQTLIPHVQDSSFPSDHLTLIWAVGFSLALHKTTRLAGYALALVGIPVAWARIYLGVHFPLDMIGAALVALCSAKLAVNQERRLSWPLTQLLLHAYRMIFSGLIRRGWVRQ